MLASIVHHLVHCSTFELICWDFLAALTITSSPWAVWAVADHALAARRASQGIN